MKTTNKLLFVSMMLTVGMIETNGQNTFPTGVGTDVGIGTNAPATRLQVIGGSSRFGAAANYGQFASDGDLTFTGNADYLVGGNRYAFRYSADQDYGIFFNQTNLRYEFRDATAIPVFYATTVGEGFFARGVQIGNSILNTAGNIRWTGADFEGFDGAVWRSLTATGITSESDPQVGTNAASKVPRWNGTALVEGTIVDNGTNIGIGISAPSSKLSLSNTSLSGIATTGSFQIGETSTTNLVIDNNEVQARSNGAGNTLFLQFWDGGLNACSSGGTTSFGGPISASSNLNVTGNVGIGTTSPSVKLQVDGGTDSSPGSGGYIVTGSTTGLNLSMDNNEIMARNNGVASDLFLNNSGGNLITNANGGNVGIRTTAPTRNLHVSCEQFTGNSGIEIEQSFTGNSWVLYPSQSANNLNLFYNNIQVGGFDDVSGVYTATSDERLKTNIKPMEDMLSKIMKLEPKTYEYKSDSKEKNKYFGFLAQDLIKILPEVVDIQQRDDKDGKTMNDLHLVSYTEIIPVMVAAMQEQQLTIASKTDELGKIKEELAQLKASISRIDESIDQCCSNDSKYTSSLNSFINPAVAILEQNAPNPFKDKTTIRYYIPENVKDALVKIYSLNGDAIKTIQVNGTGKGSVEVNGGSLAAGTYTYQLILDGKTIDTKLMVITK